MFEEQVGNGNRVHLAVEVKNGWLNYGRIKRTQKTVLQGINIAIPRGRIYSLLGPSGCGKTTLLKCIVGRLTLEKGSLRMFGNLPGSGVMEIPGRDVGYMPQELALFLELTINENLRYFSRLHGMTKDQWEKRTKFLLEFLKLNEEKTFVKNLSGGQQRRASFAVALIHQPPLLILDEPTVGVDPVLRISIWNHLLKLSQTSDVTVVITTHYIEEARQADVVGLMRNGHLLTEDSPELLLERYQSDNLENVFLQLCQPEKPDSRNVNNGSTNEVMVNTVKELKSPDVHNKLKRFCQLPGSSKIFAIVIKNFTAFSRMLIFLVFQFLMPAIQITLFCIAVGQDPHNLPVSVFNRDMHEGGLWFLGNLSSSIIKQQPVNCIKEGLNNVEEGKSFALINIGENFTQFLQSRVLNPLENGKYLNGSQIDIRLDRTDQIIAYSLQREFSRAFQEVITAVAGIDTTIIGNLLSYESPVYGNEEPTFTEFIAPGVVSAFTFFMAVGLTSVAFIMDRKEGLLDRTAVAGVTATEVMLSHIITQFGVMVIQISLMITCLLIILKIASQEPILWLSLLALLQGLCGMCFGLLISCVCDHENSAVMLNMGIFFPNVLFGGILWPVEAMPEALQYISHILPFAYPADAMRNILIKRHGLQFMDVWIGFAVTTAWIFIFFILISLIMKIKRI